MKETLGYIEVVFWWLVLVGILVASILIYRSYSKLINGQNLAQLIGWNLVNGVWALYYMFWLLYVKETAIVVSYIAGYASQIMVFWL